MKFFLKKPPQKVAYLSRNSIVSDIFFLLPYICPTAQMAEFTFQNVAYRATVYITGAITWSFPVRTCIKVATKIITINLETMFNASSWVIKEIEANSLNFIAERCNCCWCCYLIFWLVQFHFLTASFTAVIVPSGDFRAFGVALEPPQKPREKTLYLESL